MVQMQALGNSIIFQFNDNTKGLGFDNVSTGGIVFTSYDHDAKSPRWGTALFVGPDVKYVKPGSVILIDNLRWTEGHEYEGLKFWQTNENEVLCIREED